MNKAEKDRRKTLKKLYFQSDPEYVARKAREEKMSLSVEDIQNALFLDEDPEGLVVQVITNRLFSSKFRKDETVFAEIPDAARHVYATWLLECEVMNGGLDQFFGNHTLQDFQRALDGYRYFGLTNCLFALQEVLKKIAFDISDFDREDTMLDAESLHSAEVKKKHISDHPEAYVIP